MNCKTCNNADSFACSYCMYYIEIKKQSEKLFIGSGEDVTINEINDYDYERNTETILAAESA